MYSLYYIMFNFTRAYRAIDVSLFEAQEKLEEQERMLKFVGKYSMGDDIRAKKIKLEELIDDLKATKERMKNLSGKDKLEKLHSLTSMTPREFTLRVIVHEKQILEDPRVGELLKDSKISSPEAMYIADSIMEDYQANTGIRWLIAYL